MVTPPGPRTSFLPIQGCLRSGLSWFNWWVSFAPDFQCCSPVIITDRPKRYFRCGFICFMFGAVQFLNVLILTLLCDLLDNLVKLTELPPVWERTVNSAYHLLFVIC